MIRRPTKVTPPKGKLGVLTPGMGAVTTTFIAGVELIRKGHAAPIGSLTQMGTIRLGKRTEGRAPEIKKFVALAKPEDQVVGLRRLGHLSRQRLPGSAQGGRAE